MRKKAKKTRESKEVEREKMSAEKEQEIMENVRFACNPIVEEINELEKSCVLTEKIALIRNRLIRTNEILSE